MKFLKNFFKKNHFENGLIDFNEKLIKEFVEHSITSGSPIVVGSQMAFNTYKSINPDVVIFRLGKNFTFEFKNKEFPNGVLVDSTVSLESKEWLSENNIEIVGGFKEIES